ncbi:T9SS type A sorting domain-containing protein [Algoriphagus sp. AK58]|uniref:T9SS type A sorting domain-containing protein n=1 Tax=Algoriphagus sp. AK58 TaxID=1406877 RepID=UPI00164FD4A2|nr:T9SS type A sorting domain-containing protein [Algoriphagus sp. AK58]
MAVAGLIMSLGVAYSQEMGAYKTLSSGDFPNISIWATWNGTSWVPAAAKPGLLNDIYIDQNHTLRLTGNEQAKSVFINAEAEAGQKLNLNGFNLDIYGTLSAFSGPAPGVPANAWNSQNWIGNSLSSTITFRGNSRKILDKSSWSAQTTQSRFGVIFDPGFGVELTVEAPLKALSFTVKSGTLIQKLDTSVIPNVCFTLSFNTETTVFGSGPFGDFTIEDGATFISECNSNIVNRSTNGSVSALNFDLQNGGTLILEGSAPRIEAANFQLNGRIIFRGPSGPKSFLSSSFSDAASPQSVRHLELQSSQNLSLPNQLFLLGNMTKSGTGNFLTSNTHLILTGSTNQEIIGFPLRVRDLTLNKPNGIFFPRGNLTVERTLTLTQGRIDLQQNDLRINTSGQGGINYGGGSWRNAGSVTYFNIPSLLTATNATFPFEDMLNGGIRKIQLLGPSPGGNLSLRFLEYKGANHDPKFNDTDGTPILYQLYSHFQFSGLSPSNQEVELKISAASLIVDNVDDLRVVGTGQPSPGNHLPGLDPSLLWARRSLQWDELSNFNFTIGSFRELSILPVSWISINVSQSASGKMITWKVGQERNNLLFEIYRSHVEKLEWEKIGSIASKGNSKNPVEYSFEDKSTKRFKEYLYRIRQISLDGSESWSVVARTFQYAEGPTHNLLVYPNPHERGPLRIWASKNWDFSDAKLMILSLHGQVLLELPYASEIQEQFVNALAPGNYFLHLVTPYQSFSTRFIKH